NATYTASRPSARIAALCMGGESDWATGSPRRASRRALAPISMLPFLHQALHHGRDQALELGAGVAVDVQVTTEWVAHLGVVPFAAGVLPQHEHLALTSQLVHPRAVMAGHGEDHVGGFAQLAREQPRAMPGEIEAPLQADEIRAFGSGGAVPRAGAGGDDGDAGDAALRDGQ